MSTRQHPTNAPLFRFFIRIMVLAPSVGLTMQAAATPVSLEQADARARKIVSEMSFADKVAYTGGLKGVAVFNGPQRGGYNWCGTLGMKPYGVRAFTMADASAGLRIRNSKVAETLKGGDYPENLKATAFPALICLAATWDPQAASDYAAALAREARSKGVDILLGPGINIQRQAQNGRSFEYMGEDPVLTGRMAASYIRALQAGGVIAMPKHFACNQTEWYRKENNVIVDERTLREIYLPAFEAAVRDGGALALMPSYNLINGEWTGQNKWLLTDILKNNMGFQGMVVSDWASVYHPEAVMRSGLDLVMPDNTFIREAFEKGMITEAEHGPLIDRMVTGFLRPCIMMGLLDQTPEQRRLQVPWDEHDALVRRIGAQGMVLLKNEGSVLPLAPGEPGVILVTGPNAVDTPTGGGGSGGVPGWNQVDIVTGLAQLYGDSRIAFSENPSEEQLSAAWAVVVCVGFDDGFDRENVDRPFPLPEGHDALVARCAAANPRTVVLLSGGSAMEMPWIDKVPAIIHTLYLGQAVGHAVADVLSGAINPSGHLPFTMQKKATDFPAKKGSTLEGLEYLLKVEEGGRVQVVEDGEEQEAANNPRLNTPAPDMRTTMKQYKDIVFREGKKVRGKDVYDLPYTEGVFVGYRWYDQEKIAVHFPFGHGLSYTAFALSNLKLSVPAVSGDQIQTVAVSVWNTGDRAGATVVQLYVSDPVAGVPRPPKELKGFQRVMLQPGESRIVEFTLNKRDLSFWDLETGDWKAEPGEFRVLVGLSSADTPLTAAFQYNEQPPADAAGI